MIRFNKKIQGTRNSDDYATPKKFYKKLNNEFNFDFDPCPLNHDLNEWNGLNVYWNGRVFCNPPYSNIKPFIEKGINEFENNKDCEYIVFLLPVRSDVKYWHELILKKADEIRFIKGRLNFNDIKTPSPFPCVLVIFDGRYKEQIKITSYE